MVSGELLTQTVVNGVLLGGIYAVAALGLSLVFGIMDVVNLAHGHFLMVGAYVAVLLFAGFGLSPLLGMAVAIVVLFAFGAGFQRYVLSRVSGAGLEQPVLILFGAALVLQNLGLFVLGSTTRSTDLSFSASLELGSVLLSTARVVTFVIAVVLVGLTWLFLFYSETGRAIRATAQNPTAAAYMGIDIDRIHVITLAVGSALAGAAGALLSMLFPIDPFVGWSYLLKAFAVVVLGGVGSVFGTLVGGVVLGVSENLGALWLGGGFRDVVSFGIFLLVLLVRPQGLFGGLSGGD